MKIRIGIFSFILLAAFLGLYGEEKVHVVQKGETFYSIARSLGIKADDLMKFNGINDPSRLQAGQRLKVPVPSSQTVTAVQTGTAAAGGYTSYRVVRGDTFFSIARNFSVTVGAIREANSLPENYMLREGDSLNIPLQGGTVGTIPAPKTAEAPKIEKQEPETKAVVPAVRWPVAAKEVSYMTGKLSGVAITGQRAEPVRSLTWGTVLSAGPYRGFGKVIIIQVEGGYLYVYGGCESLAVKEGDKVSPGLELGKLGVDTVTNKPQLYFMVYRSNTPVDPAKAPRA